MSQPLTAFNFRIEISVRGIPSLVCGAEFAEVDGLEATMQPKTIREGGNNTRAIHLAGPVSYGQLTLRRGMTECHDLWVWFDLIQQQRGAGLRSDAVVIMKAADRSEQVRFLLTRCLPVKIKAPALNAISGQVAIEELQLVYETLSLQSA